MDAIQESLLRLNAKVGQLLPSLKGLSNEQLAVVLHTYERLIRPYFISQMATVEDFCQSETARAAAGENFRCEVYEDHRSMLRRFTAQIDYYLEDPAVKEAILQTTGGGVRRQLLLPLRELIDCSDNALPGLWIMGGLETASQVFIPWMETAADRLGMNDKEYLIKHGIADIAHADEFARAIAAEAGFLGVELVPTESVDSHESLGPTFRLLSHIFGSWACYQA